MELNELNKANIDNLTSLWKKMGVQSGASLSTIKQLNKSLSWPHRCWFDWEINTQGISSIDNIISHLEDDSIIPIWDVKTGNTNRLEQLLIDEKFEVSFEQSAMFLDAKEYEVLDLSDVDVIIVDSISGIDAWTKVAIQSFEYKIDISVIQKIASDPDAHLFIVTVNTQPAATAMIYKTGEVIGIHQVGVSEAYRGKGIAYKLMLYVIARCVESSCKYITLQSSAVGQGLYEKLGFKHQFIIRNYQRTILG